jgi:hypothetical protein
MLDNHLNQSSGPISSYLRLLRLSQRSESFRITTPLRVGDQIKRTFERDYMAGVAHHYSALRHGSNDHRMNAYERIVTDGERADHRRPWADIYSITYHWRIEQGFASASSMSNSDALRQRAVSPQNDARTEHDVAGVSNKKPRPNRCLRR